MTEETWITGADQHDPRSCLAHPFTVDGDPDGRVEIRKIVGAGQLVEDQPTAIVVHRADHEVGLAKGVERRCRLEAAVYTRNVGVRGDQADYASHQHTL